MSSTLRPAEARARASAAATVVLPVPPLPVTTCSRTPSQSVSLVVMPLLPPVAPSREAISARIPYGSVAAISMWSFCHYAWGLGREVIPVGAVVAVIVILVILGLIAAARSFKVVQQYEKGIIYRFGRVMPEIRGPGLALIRPVGDRMQKVNMQIVAMAVPAQEGITRDNVSVRVDAVVYFRVVDPIKATVNVQNYMFAISQQAQTSLRSIIGQSEMDQLLAERESVNRELQARSPSATSSPTPPPCTCRASSWRSNERGSSPTTSRASPRITSTRCQPGSTVWTQTASRPNTSPAASACGSGGC